MRALPTGIVTFLFTDIEGSTRLATRLGPRYPGVLDEHHRILRAAFAAHGGVEANTEGDAFFVAFARPTDAVAACLDGQRALAAYDWPADCFEDGDGLRVRMGLHTGEAQLHAADYVGLAVHLAARIASAGHGGQVLVSDTTARIIVGGLHGGAELRDLGLFVLKDFAEPHRIHQLMHPGLGEEFSPLKAASVTTDNLPRQRTSFVGRETELRELAKLVEEASLVTVVGAGGVGKTRIAIEAARRSAASRADGTWLIELAPISDPDALAGTVLATLGFAPQPGRDDLDVLTENLRSRRALLVIDNCEHLVGPVAALVDVLLGECPDLTVLATSREPLGVDGEHPWRLPSLPVPDEVGLSIEALREVDAVRLFTERATLVRPGFVLDETNVASVVAVCRRLDGIPLAIELAAARVRTLSPDAIATRLDDRFTLLTGGSRSALSRQQTLRALVDWSYDLLSQEERAALRRLSIFVDGFTIAAAEHVVPEAGESAGAVLDLVGALVDKSLVAFDDVSRYRMLETVRHYGREKLLGEGDEAAAVRDRHLDWCVAFAIATEAAARYDLDARDVLEADSGNLEAALEWAMSSTRAEPALVLALGLGTLWSQRGRFTDVTELLVAVLEPAETAAAPRARALALLARARSHSWHPDFPLDAERALAAADACGDPRARASARASMSQVASGAESLRWMREALEIARADGDRPATQSYLVQVGRLERELGELDAAELSLQEGLAEAEALDLDLGREYALFHWCWLLIARGDLESATPVGERVMALAEVTGDPRLVADTRFLFAHLMAAIGRPEVAIDQLLARNVVNRRIGSLRLVADGLGFLSYFYAATGRLDEARTALTEGLALVRDDPRGTHDLLNCRAEVEQAAGNVADAKARFEEVVSIAEDPWRGFAHLSLAHLAELEGDLPAAIGHLRAAVESTWEPRNWAPNLVVPVVAAALAFDRLDLAEPLFRSAPPRPLLALQPLLLPRYDAIAAAFATTVPVTASEVDDPPAPVDPDALMDLIRRTLDELESALGDRSPAA